MLVTASCSITEKPQVVLPEQQAKIDVRLTKDCNGPYALKDDTLGEISEAAIYNAYELKDCGKRYKILLKEVLGK